MKRLVLFAVTLVAAGVSAAPASAAAPGCWTPDAIPLRLNSERPAHIPCDRAATARVVAAPSHIQASVVEVGRPGVDFKLTATAETPATGTVEFEVSNDEGAKRVFVPFKILPASENRPPTCRFVDSNSDTIDTVVKRSDGIYPSLVELHARCSDPDGDAYDLTAAGPGRHTWFTEQPPRGRGAIEDGIHWLYSPATAEGREAISLVATDEVGARSPEAMLTVSIGRDANHPPFCGANAYFDPQDEVVYVRPGIARHFTVRCGDTDNDAVVPNVSTPPVRGSMLPFTPNPPPDPYTPQGLFGATYVPVASTMDRDRFGLTGTDKYGPGVERFFDLVPVSPTTNDGATCSGYGWVEADTEGSVVVVCDDKEGDPLSAEVASQPLHGVASDPEVEYDTQGTQRITVKYVPESSWTGDDLFDLRITDAYGMSQVVNVWTAVWRDVPPVLYLPGDEPETFDPAAVAASVGAGAPADSAPPATPRAIASRALGTTAIKRLSFTAQAEVWSRSTLSKRDLLKSRRSPGIVVICRAKCDIRSDSALVTGASRAARRWNVSTAKPGQLQVVTVALSNADKNRLKRARRPKASFTVRVKAGGQKARTVRRSIRVTG